MITLFCVRPKGLNVGNEAIFTGLRHLLREAFGGRVNIVQVSAVESAETGALSGLRPKTIHEMNLYGHGVIVGGGNLYENGQLDVDMQALRALRPPLMLFSLSHGRIYDNRHELVPRSDAMPESVIAALHEKAVLSLARDEATLAHLRALGLSKPQLGGCPSLLVSQVELPRANVASQPGGALLSIRHPQLMSIPPRDQARLHAVVVDIVDALEADGFGPVRLLCHHTRDLAFASSLGNIEYILPDDVYSHLELLRNAPLVVSFRLHAFLPCVSFGTPAVNISYDERSLSLVRTIGLEAWDVDFVRSRDVVADIRDRCARLGDLAVLREAAQSAWRNLEAVMRDSIAAFARLATAYAEEWPVDSAG
jgi:hypothetical protein